MYVTCRGLCCTCSGDRLRGSSDRIESTSPAAADASLDPVVEYVTSALAEPIPVGEHRSEEQLATAVAALRQRETVLQSLLEAEASRLGDLLVQEEEEGVQRAPKKTKRKKH